MENQPIIVLSNLSVFQKNKLVLTNVNLEINQGEFIYMIGKTGSGKSSLMQILYADLPIEEGHANICGYDIETIKQKSLPFLRRKLGIVFQDFQLLDDRTIKQNLEFVLKATGWKDKKLIENRILEVLDEVELIEKLNVMPHQLSGGEQQRVSIARAIAGKPKILFADEPTANLDTVSGNQVIDLIAKVNKEENQTVVMVTHEREYAMGCDRIIHMEDGVVVDVEYLK